jgi:hypothetical protein
MIKLISFVGFVFTLSLFILSSVYVYLVKIKKIIDETTDIQLTVYGYFGTLPYDWLFASVCFLIFLIWY